MPDSLQLKGEAAYSSLSRVLALNWLEAQVGTLAPVAKDYFVDANRRGWRIKRDRKRGRATRYSIYPVGEQAPD